MAILALIAVLALMASGATFAVLRSPDDGPAATPAAKCTTPVRVVTAASFAPVLAALAPALAIGEDCARLEVTVADGRSAARRIEDLDHDVWIPDDAAWATVAGDEYAESAEGDTSAVVATSPVYFVTDRPTARTLVAAGGSWLGLAKLVSGGSDVRPVVRDPAGTGDGLIAAGALGESVWLVSGMDASAQSLAAAVSASRTVTGAGPPRPGKEREVGLVPEYALLQPGWPENQVVLAPADHTAQLRYTWVPEEDAAKNKSLAKAMARLLRTLRGPDAGPHLAAAGLRGPGGKAPQSLETRRLPQVTAKPFDVLKPHHIDHVFATWYAADRRSDLLVVVDVSGSMGKAAPGTRTPLIRLVARGCTRLGALLPSDSRVALWEFGSRLDPPRDYKPLLRRAPLTAAHRKALDAAATALAPRPTGTGLYDTLLAAYISARDTYRRGTPNQVVLFTDGRNEADPGSITAQQLTSALKKANDPRRPVQLSVILFGADQQAEPLTKVLAPVEGHVQQLETANEVDATFIHVAAGGLVH